MKLILKKIYHKIVPNRIKNVVNKLRKRKNKTIKIDSNDFIKKVSKYDVISFDLFDTLITRTLYNPDDLFILMDTLVKEKYDFNGTFIDKRKEAENSARINLNKDVNLDEIYNEMKKLNSFDDKLIKYLKKTEIELELFHLVPRVEMLDIYNQLVEKGKKVIITSDMYLDKKTIEKILSKTGYTNYYKIYLSNDYNARKDTGKLFDIVKKDFDKQKIIHIGDNDNSDVLIPKGKKIDSYKIYSSKELLKQSNYYNVLKDDIEDIKNTQLIGLIFNKYIFNSPFSANNIDKLEDLSYGIIAPLMYKFMEKIVSETKKDDKLLFLAREGYYLQKLYKDFIKIYSYNEVDNKYFLASRKATYNAILKSEEDIKDLINKNFTGDMKSFVNQIFGIEYKNDNFNIQLPQDLNIVFDKLKPYFKEILDKVKLEKEAYIEYIKDNYSNYKKDNLTVVDLGYAGTIQYNLAKLLDKDINGIYLTNSNPKKKYKKSKSIYTFDTDDNNLYEKIYNYSLVFEFFLSAPFGQLMYFKKEKNKVVPVYNDEKMENKKKEDLDLIYTNIIKFFDDIKEMKKIYNFEIDNSFIVKSYITTIESNFIGYNVKDRFDFVDLFDSTESKNVFKIIGRYY